MTRELLHQSGGSVPPLPADEFPVVTTPDELERRFPDLRGVWVSQLGREVSALDWGSADVTGAVFAGCEPDADTEQRLRAGGATVLPPIEAVGFDPYRASLYSNEELMSGYVRGDATSTLDARIGAACTESPSPLMVLARGVHDACIDAALLRFLAKLDHPVVGVMGSHSTLRGAPEYVEVAMLGRELTRRGFVVTTGGGPGMMEAANLGAWLADEHDDALDAACSMLRATPEYEPDASAYVEAALAVRERWPKGSTSLGVPTWIYVDEPFNQFASHIAKYFQNSIRENGLLAIALAGIVYTAGGSGTYQEIFTDAAQNDYTLYDVRSPMVFLGDAYTRGLGREAITTLRTLAEKRGWDQLLRVVDDATEAVEAIVQLLPSGVTAPQPPLRKR